MVRISVELPEEMAEALARAADDLQSTREAVLLQAARGFLTDLEMSRESGDFAAFAASDAYKAFVAEGEAAVAAGQLVPAEQVFAEMRAIIDAAKARQGG